MTARRTLLASAGAFGAFAAAQRVARAVAGTRIPADVAVEMPGDDLVPTPGVVLDRATVLPAPAEHVWPWLVQLGKQRAGWYLPRSVERVIPPGRRGLRQIEPRWQSHDVGDRIPDWGPGSPLLELVDAQPPSTLVYLSLRDRADGQRWPAEPDAPTVLRMSWVLHLSDLTGDRSRLHLRVRATAEGWLLRHLADPLDTATVLGLFAGLRERLAAAEQ